MFQRISMVNLVAGSGFFVIGLLMMGSQVLLIRRRLRLLKEKKGPAAYNQLGIVIASVVLLGFLIFTAVVLYFLGMALSEAYPPG